MSTSPSVFDLIPVSQPPPGVESNFVNPEDEGYVMIAAGSVFIGLMLIFCMIRLYSKAFIVRRASWDDLTCAIATLGTLAYFISAIIGVVYSPLGKHLWDVRVEELESKEFAITVTFLGVILTWPTLLAAKVTILILYLELFRPIRWMRIWVYIGITVTSLYYIGFGIAQIYLATPKSGQTWFTHLTSPEEVTLQFTSVPFAGGGLGIDIFILILPMKAVMALQVRSRQRFGVAVVFLAGLMACVASVISFWLRLKGDLGTDLTYNTTFIVLAAIAEMCVGVIVACMPSFSKVFRHHLPALKKASSAVSSCLGTARRALLRSDKASNSAPFSSAGRTILRPDSPAPSSHYEPSMNPRMSQTSHSESRLSYVSPLSSHHEEKIGGQSCRSSQHESKRSGSDLGLPIEGASGWSRSSVDSLRAQEEGLSFGFPHNNTERSGQDLPVGHESTLTEKAWQESHDTECAWYEASGG